MPRLQRRSKRQPAPMPDHELAILLCGVGPRRSEAALAFFGDRDAQRVRWEANRNALMAWWVEQNPGRRPAAWWLFSAPEPRKRIDGPEGAERDALLEEMNAKWPSLQTMRPSFGLPRLKLPGDKFETETDYLRRLGLMSEAESQQCPA